MRMMVKVQLETAAANESIRAGRLGAMIERQVQELKPEAAYFYVENGRRTGFMILDVTDPSQIPSLVEPWYMEGAAHVEVIPVMNALELKAGLVRLEEAMLAPAH